MTENLTPELRTDKNGKVTKRWVRPSATSPKGNPIPAPSSFPSSPSLQELKNLLITAIDGNGHSPHLKDEEKSRVNEVVNSGRTDAMDLLQVFQTNAASNYPLQAFETLYDSLQKAGVKDLVRTIDDRALMDASRVIANISGPTPDEFTDDMHAMIGYTITSDERETIVNSAAERCFSSLEEMKAFVASLRSTEKPLQSGIL